MENTKKQSDLPNVKLPWVEKYRPKSVEEISHQEEIVKTLQKSIASGSLPHLLFYGPPGTGKTSTILAVARQLFSQDFRKNGRVLELNASDERGISVVREKVKSFAQGAIAQNHFSANKMPPFKLIILDEADSMTADAQAALRRMMENYSKITRFCLICNYVSRIVEPVASRCAKFRFKPLEKQAIQKRLEYICTEEQTTWENGVMEEVLEFAEGDMRKAINFLQSARQLNNKQITKEVILGIAGVVPEELLTKVWLAIKSNSFDKLKLEIDDLVASGFPSDNILSQMQKEVICHKEMNEVQKGHICLRIAKADHKLADGASEYLQILDVFSFVMRTFHQN